MKIKLLLFFLIRSYFSVSQNIIDTIIFSHNSGIYQDSITLSISNLNKDKIFYSDDGDYPKTEYTRPILLNKSTTIRVKNRKTLRGYARNYLFPGRKIELPIICITINNSDLYDSKSGIYVKGLKASKEPPYQGANFHKNWERASYIEFIDTNNTVGFNQKVGLKIFGQFSSMLPQKSFSIYSRKKYGKGKIKYSLFPNLPFKKYNNFVLRNGGSDNCNSHIRDVMMTSLVKKFNLDIQDYRSCIVYLNGKYWGIYHLREKLNEHYLKQHHKIDKDSIAIMKHRMDVQYYGRLNYKEMLKFIKQTNFEKDSNIYLLSKMMDIDNYLDYNVAQVYFSNVDAGGNIRYWRERKEGSKWKWILYDTDFGFGLRKGNGAEENTLKRFTESSSEAWPFPSWSTLIIRKLLENDSIKRVYLQKFMYHLNTTFRKDNVKHHINTIACSLEAEMPHHLTKWGKDPKSWKSNINNLLDFAEKRPYFLFTFLKEKFDFDTIYRVRFDYSSLEGTVFFDSYLMNQNDEGSYFSLSDYSLIAKPNFGYKFSHWKNGSDRDSVSFNLKSDTVISAVFVIKGESNYKNKLRFNEIGINDSLYSSYIELYNDSELPIDISKWIIKSDSMKIEIENGVFIKPKGFYTILRKRTNRSEIVNNAQFNLFKINKGDGLQLFSDKEELVDEVVLIKSIFRDYNIMEFVSSSIEKAWLGANRNSIGDTNKRQEDSELENLFILNFFLAILSLVTFTASFFFFRKRRLHSSIE